MALCVFNYTLNFSYKMMNSLAGLHSPATYCSVRMYAHTLTYFTAYHPPSTAASSTVPIKPLVGNVDFFKYESEKQNQEDCNV